MDGSSPIILSIILVILFIITLIIYLYSSAIRNVNDNELEEIREKDEALYKKINKIIDYPTELINTVQSASVLITLIVGMVIGVYIEGLIRWLVSGLLWIIVFMTFGIIIPKKLGTRNSKRKLCKMTGIVYLLGILYKPITIAVQLISNVFLRICGIDPNEPEENVTEEDIISVINEGHEQGVLLASEAEMINNIVEFGDKDAMDIMTRRTNIVGLDGEMLLEEAAKNILKLNKSRFPVYIGDIDNIIGVVNFRDIMSESQKDINNKKKLCDINGLVRKATFIPETKKINVLFKVMQSEKIHMAIVIDEYGQTSGIVAMEDILEEIVGNILDEYDEDDIDIIRREDGAYVVKGTTSLDDITEKLGISFSEDYETLNGFLTYKFERILANDERPELVIDNVRYKILSVKNRMIALVLISLPENE